jgi:membrane protease YdiL (CAAX protease family)
VAVLSYAALLFAFWMAARQFRVTTAFEHFPSAFTCFALLLSPYWFFGFGLAVALRARLKQPWLKIVLPGLLVIPYLVFAIPRGDVIGEYILVFAGLPVAMAALFEFVPARGGITWQDILVLAVIGLPVEFGLFRNAWPVRGLAAMPKLLLMDAALYAFLVVRGAPDVGYDFRPRWRDLAVGLREWAFFAPIAIGLGLVLHFIHFRVYAPYLWQMAAAWLVTFFFVAIPEELFFRGLLQNIVEKRLSRTYPPFASLRMGRSNTAKWKALFIAALIFGLSHFNKPLPFNWRYVLLATIAGIFYGRAWRDRHRLFCSGVTHATVDVVWSLWFR